MPRRKIGFWYRLAVTILRPLMLLIAKRDWRGTEHLLPGGQGAVYVTNHISHVDPVAFAHFLYDHGLNPRFLAKAGLFGVPVVGAVLRGAGQIPVHRFSAAAADAYRDAVAAVQRGEAVVIYPEGTITRDPELWPMSGRTGAARVALATGCPVIPVAQWGAHELLPPYAKRPRLLPRRTMRMLAGPPVDLDEFRDQPINTELLRRATDRILDDVTALLAELRGEQPPPRRVVADAPERPTTPRPAVDGEDGPAVRRTASATPDLERGSA